MREVFKILCSGASTLMAFSGVLLALTADSLESVLQILLIPLF